MYRLNVVFLTFNNPLHVHKATTITPRNVLGSCLHVVKDFISSHASTNLRLFDRIHTAEAATLIYTFGLNHLNTFDKLQQVTYLILIR